MNKVDRLKMIREEIDGYKKDIEMDKRIGVYHEIPKYEKWIEELELEKEGLEKASE